MVTESGKGEEKQRNRERRREGQKGLRCVERQWTCKHIRRQICIYANIKHYDWEIDTKKTKIARVRVRGKRKEDEAKCWCITKRKCEKSLCFVDCWTVDGVFLPTEITHFFWGAKNWLKN